MIAGWLIKLEQKFDWCQRVSVSKLKRGNKKSIRCWRSGWWNTYISIFVCETKLYRLQKKTFFFLGGTILTSTGQKTALKKLGCHLFHLCNIYFPSFALKIKYYNQYPTMNHKAKSLSCTKNNSCIKGRRKVSMRMGAESMKKASADTEWDLD